MSGQLRPLPFAPLVSHHRLLGLTLPLSVPLSLCLSISVSIFLRLSLASLLLQDVLEIMRNLPKFVLRFGYNLNQQFFIERRTFGGSKHINTVSLHSISSCIRQHGTGMVNTTVNFAYQLLVLKFRVFSQFL